MDPLFVIMQIQAQLRRMRQKTFRQLTEMYINLNILYGQTYIRFEAVQQLLNVLLEQYRTAQNEPQNLLQQLATTIHRHQQQQQNLQLNPIQAGSSFLQQHMSIPQRQFPNSDEIEEIVDEKISIDSNGNSNYEGDQNRTLADDRMAIASTSNSTVDDKTDESNNEESTITEESGVDHGTDLETPSNESPMDLSNKEQWEKKEEDDEKSEKSSDVDDTEQDDEDAIPIPPKKIRTEEKEEAEESDQNRNLRCIVVSCDYHCTTLLDMLAHVERTHQMPVPKVAVVKAFHCKWTNCTHTSDYKQATITHIRTIHFHLPATMKEQKKRRIEDVRNPEEYLGSALDSVEH